MAQKTKNFTVDDIIQLLQSHGAGRDSKSPIRIWDYETLIPSKKTLNNLKVLGKGGFGAVYNINIEGLDYALKIMTQRRGETSQQLIDNFYNECKSLLSVNHNRVLRLIGVALDTSDEDEYCFCHYTNYQQKGNLLDIIKNRQLFPEAPPGSPQRFYKKIRLLGQIAEGIHAIHQVGLIHRDIKAQNVFLDENDAPKVADLGLAGDDTKMSTSKARGTAQWMAPEVFEYRVSPASDIWALACVAVEIFNETLPYPQLKDMVQIRDYICNQRRFPDFSQEITQDQNLAQLLLQSFKFNYQERPNILYFRQVVEQIKQRFEPNQIPYQQQNNPISGNNQSQIQSNLSQNQNTQGTFQGIQQVGQFQPQSYQLQFLGGNNTILYKSGEMFQKRQLANSGIFMDEGSSVYYTTNQIYVSGGVTQQCSRNFQIISKSTLQVVKTCQMANPRSGHGMIQVMNENNEYIYIISGSQNPQKDEDKCECFDVSAGTFKEFDNITFSGKNFGCIQQGQDIIVVGGISSEFLRLCIIQHYDYEINAWKISEQCLPIGSAVSMVQAENGSIYMFGEYLEGVYQFT